MIKSWLKPLIPHEHGAWGILAIPLLIGTALYPSWAALAIGICAFALFLLRTAFLRWLKGAPLALARNGMIVCAFIAGAAGIPLLWMGRWNLLWILAAAGVAGSLEALWPAWTKRYRLLRHWTDVVVLTALAPAVVYAGQGYLNQTAGVAWALCAIYFGWRTAIVRGQVGVLIAQKRGADIKAVGWREVRYSLVFAVLTILLLRIVQH